MMATWMTYVLIVACLLVGAAMLAEPALRNKRRVWALVMLLAVGAPLVATFIAQPAAALAPGRTATSTATMTTPVASRDVAPHARAPAISAASVTAPWLTDSMLRTLWMVSSAGALLLLAGAGLSLALSRRNWAAATLHGTPVLVSDTTGPAVLGWMRPQIVVPRWLLDAPGQQQRLVLVHEQSHLAAHDSRLLALALVLLVVMPWNLPLWYALRRLRLAIELDCDARVLRAGHDRQQYGSVLIDVAARQSGFLPAGAAMAQSRSMLERRIRALLPKSRRASAPLLLLLAGSLCGAAATIDAPPLPSPLTSSSSMTRDAVADPSGYYRLNEMQVAVVGLRGKQLTLAVGGQRALTLDPVGPGQFVTEVANKHAALHLFVNSKDTLTLRQNGIDMLLRRIDASAVEATDRLIVARQDAQLATPGGEAVLRRNAEAVLAGRLVLADLSPEFGAAVSTQLPALQKTMREYGAVETVEFRGIGMRGWDMYRVRHANATVDWYLLFDAKGKVIDANVVPAR